MNTPQIIFPNFLSAKDILSDMLEDEIAKLDAKVLLQNFEIAGCHGQIPGLYWSEKSRLGGNPAMYSYDFQAEVSLYVQQHIPIFLDFDNPLLVQEDMYNRFGNHVLQMFNNISFDNVVICSSKALQSHVKNHYESLKTCWRFFDVNNATEIVERLNDNEYVLLPTRYGYNKTFLESIPKYFRKRCIISINDTCDISCPKFERHLQESSEIALMITQKECSDFCEYFYGLPNDAGKSHYIKPLDYSYVVNEIMELGYNIFYIDAAVQDEFLYIKESCDFLGAENRKVMLIDLFCSMSSKYRY